MPDIINAGNKQDKWTLRVTELLNWLNDNKQAVLTEGDNISLTPQEDGTVKISASGGGEGTVSDVQLGGTSIVDQNGVADIPVMKGATSQSAGEVGLVPAPAVADRNKYLKGDGTWGEAGGAVDDVQMNGKSIVQDKIASFNNYVEITQSEYDALPDSKKADDVLYCTKDAGIMYLNGVVYGGEKFAPVIYSLEEREIGVWTDGKPVYQKVLHQTDLVKGAYTSIYITDLNVDTMVKFSGQYLRQFSGGGSSWELYNMHDTISSNGATIISQLRWKSDTKRLLYYNGAAGGDTIPEAWFIIQYTKTTDTPGSGKWTTQGVPAVHYDGNEKVIGTWFGETLYEKTWDFGSDISVLNNTWTDTPIPAGGISKIISTGGLGSNGTNYNFLGATVNGRSYVAVIQGRGSLIVLRYLTLQYTKKP